MIVTTRSLPCTGQAAAETRGGMQEHLRQCLERLSIGVPSVADHREELPALVARLVRRFAEEERVPAPSFEDDALACLWRQPWSGNVRQLENVVFRLVLTAPGQALPAALVERVLRATAGDCLGRVSSRRPAPELVRAALRTTQTARGGVNKTRASLYLGWDPDTLVARMTELGFDTDPNARIDALDAGV